MIFDKIKCNLLNFKKSYDNRFINYYKQKIFLVQDKREYNSERRRKQHDEPIPTAFNAMKIRENITPRGDGNYERRKKCLTFQKN